MDATPFARMFLDAVPFVKHFVKDDRFDKIAGHKVLVEGRVQPDQATLVAVGAEPDAIASLFAGRATPGDLGSDAVLKVALVELCEDEAEVVNQADGLQIFDPGQSTWKAASVVLDPPVDARTVSRTGRSANVPSDRLECFVRGLRENRMNTNI